MDAPRVWIGCLACYNDGRLLGEWVDAIEAGEFRPHGDTAEDVFTDEIGNPHEELWCFDIEGFGGFLDSECSPMEAQRIAEAIESIPDYIPAEAVAAWLDNTGDKLTDWGEIEDGFTEIYCGEWDSEAEYAEEFAEETGAINRDADWPYSYVDWDHAADELDLWTAKSPDHKLFVFRQN